MSIQPGADAPVRVALSEHLQAVTEALAVARTQQGVFSVVLTPALTALDALVGAVLLVDETATRLEIAHIQGDEEGARTLWQDGPLDGDVPAGDALSRHESLFFEQEGDLVRAYPELEARTGGVATVATAVLPMFLDDRPLGVIILDFHEPHEFTGEEKCFLRILAAQCAIALGRARLTLDLERRVEERTQQIQEDARTHEAFVAFTELVGSETDVLVLCHNAFEVMDARFVEYSSAYYEIRDGLWKALAWTTEMTPEQIHMIRSGLPLDVPSFAQALGTKQPVFIDGWDATRERIENTDVFGPVCIYPLVVGSEVRGIFTVGLRVGEQWQPNDYALMRALGRSLTLALERTEATRVLQARNAELDARTKALEGIARLSRDLALRTDRQELIRRAQEMVLSLLSPGLALFYEHREGRWHATVQVGSAGTPELQAAIDAGLPVGSTPTLDRPGQTHEAFFQDRYDQALDVDPELVRHLQTVATLPVLVNGEVLGLFNVGLFHAQPWSVAERALLSTTVSSLGLTIEGAEGVTQLTQERQKLEAANEELEAFAYGVSHDLRTPVRHVMGFNQLLRKHLEGGLDAKTTRYLQVVDEAAGRMNTLIDAMLDLSRTSRLPLRLGPVDLGDLVGAVRLELEADVLDREVEWHVQPLPLVEADLDTLRQVITNLLDNALKYTRTREVAKVEVWAEERPEEWVISVRDNGVGFDPRYSTKLFGVFQRLHRAEEFEGTGVGLANVRRIIARHGGRVWAEGQPGEGATFGFTLPKP